MEPARGACVREGAVPAQSSQGCSLSLRISLPLASAPAGPNPSRTWGEFGTEFFIISQHLDNCFFLIACLAEAPLSRGRREATGASFIPCKRLLSRSQ